MRKTAVVGIILLLIGGLIWAALYIPAIRTKFGSNTASAVSPSIPPGGNTYANDTLAKTYQNDAYRFSVNMPENFIDQEFPNEDASEGSTIVLQDTAGNGIQILVSPMEDRKVLTAEDVRLSIPDLRVSEDQVLEIGVDYKGVAFRSNNDAFGGDSREVWFVFRGNLYQISTYAYLDPLLKAMFATWKFY